MKMSINTNNNNEDNLHGLEDLDDTRQTAPLEIDGDGKPIMTYQVRKCCEEMPHHMYVIKETGDKQRIDMEQDEYSNLEDVKYCMYCGNRLRLEVRPESLSAKDRALDELRIEMEGEQQK
jgi:hypothetical protein